MEMEMEGLDDDFYKLHRFQPTKEEAVTYLLPRLLAGTPLPHGADRLVYHADVYACEPRDLAAQFDPVPTAVRTGDRFFFTTCRHKSENDTRIARGAGAGTWAVQKTNYVYEGPVKVGEVKHLSFKKSNVSTGWVMEEYRCLLPEASVAGGEKVLCKIHLAPNPPAAARQESNAYKLRQEPAQPAHAPQPAEPMIQNACVQKRPAPVAAADLSSCKKMRMAAPVPVPVAVPEPEEEAYEDCPTWPTRAAPVSLPTACTDVPAAPEPELEPEAEADDDTGRLSCTIEELLGVGKVQQQEQFTLPVDLQSLLADYNEEEAEQVKRWNHNADLAPRIDWETENFLRPWTADAEQEEAEQTVGAMVQEEEQTLPIEAENNIQQLGMERYQHLVASIDREYSEELQGLLADHGEDEARLYRSCTYNADLHAPWLEGRNHFFSFGAAN